jgi:exodeoxyribonuclease VII small subunit
MTGAGKGAREEGEEISFEAALARLEALVTRLERGDLPLEEALATFEEGVALSRRCAERLEAAERRIEILVGEGAGELRPFEEPGDTAE